MLLILLLLFFVIINVTVSVLVAVMPGNFLQPGLQGSRAEADQLLLGIYSSINEPDGIYAVARGHSIMSQLKLYEHEGSWDRALAGYDMMCHRTASGQTQVTPASASTSASATASGDTPMASVDGQQGLLTALQQLGCRHLIEAYWQGQPGSLTEGWLP